MSSIQKQKGLLILKKRFLIFLFYIQKNGLSMKSKVSTLDIRIKQSGLMVSHFKVPNSDQFQLFDDYIHNQYSLIQGVPTSN